MNQKYTFHVSGMHCNACVLMIESELQELPYIQTAVSSFNNHTVEVVGDFGDKIPEIIANELSQVLLKHGYSLSVEKLTFAQGYSGHSKKNSWSDFKIAIPLALAFSILFIFLQKIGLVNIINTGQVTYGTAFIIGIVASLSTCMAVVGGLLLSMSATFAKDGDKIKPQMLFHLGRIISFFVLGGVIGAIGSAFTLSTFVTFILSLLIAMVMFILGINLLDVFIWAKKLQPSMPKFLSKHALGVTKFNHTFTPFLIGVVTFFLPCGFTQSMQIYTLSTGNFITGGLTMLSFALGTLPVLSLISFSSFSIQNSKKSGVFFKTAGIIVIMFALFNLINSLAVIGVIPPIFNF